MSSKSRAVSGDCLRHAPPPLYREQDDFASLQKVFDSAKKRRKRRRSSGKSPQQRSPAKSPAWTATADIIYESVGQSKAKKPRTLIDGDASAESVGLEKTPHPLRVGGLAEDDESLPLQSFSPTDEPAAPVEELGSAEASTGTEQQLADDEDATDQLVDEGDISTLKAKFQPKDKSVSTFPWLRCCCPILSGSLLVVVQSHRRQLKTPGGREKGFDQPDALCTAESWDAKMRCR